MINRPKDIGNCQMNDSVVWLIDWLMELTEPEWLIFVCSHYDVAGCQHGRWRQQQEKKETQKKHAQYQWRRYVFHLQFVRVPFADGVKFSCTHNWLTSSSSCGVVASTWKGGSEGYGSCPELGLLLEVQWEGWHHIAKLYPLHRCVLGGVLIIWPTQQVN